MGEGRISDLRHCGLMGPSIKKMRKENGDRPGLKTSLVSLLYTPV